MARLLGPDVVSDEGLRELVGLGYRIEVVCLGPAERRDGGVWYGLWGIRCVSVDGLVDRVLVAARPDKVHGGDRPRTFRTLAGLVGFLHGLGLRTISIPFEVGGRTLHDPMEQGPQRH